MDIVGRSTSDNNRTWFILAFDRRNETDTEAYRWLLSSVPDKIYEHEDSDLGYQYFVEVAEEVIKIMMEAYEECLSDSITRH